MHFAVFDLKTRKDINPMNVLGGNFCDELGRGGGGAPPQGNKDDKYGGVDSGYFKSDGKQYDLVVDIDSNSGAVVKSLELPAPILTYSLAPYNASNYDVYGVAVNKAQNLNFNLKVNYIGTKIEKVMNECGIYRSPFNLNPLIVSLLNNSECIASKLGVTKDVYLNFMFAELIGKRIEEGGCRQQRNFLIFDTSTISEDCLAESRFRIVKNGSISLPIENIELMFYKGESEITQERICEIGQPCHNGSHRYWNDGVNGQFLVGFNSPTLNSGDKIKAKLRVFTNTVLNVGGKDYNINMNGNESGFSNELVMPEKENFWAVVEHPLAYDSACVMADRVWSGPLGDDDFGDRGDPFNDHHNGVDIRAINESKPCKVNTVAPGKVIQSTSDVFGAYFVDIDHLNGYETRYIHGKDLLVAEGQYVGFGTFVFEMGCTGLCTGRHLHFELREIKILVDPFLPQFFDNFGGDGTLYNRTKKY